MKVGNIFTKTTDVTSGVPQGTILSPILSIVYINNSYDCVSSTSGVPQGTILSPILSIVYIKNSSDCVSSTSGVP